MSKYTAVVIKTGNSVALRVPKQYAAEAELVVGERVRLPLPSRPRHQDHAKIRRLITKLQELRPYAQIDDPIAWQRESREDRPIDGRV